MCAQSDLLLAGGDAMFAPPRNPKKIPVKCEKPLAPIAKAFVVISPKLCLRYHAEIGENIMSFNRKYDSIAATAEELTDSLESGCEEINASVREGIEQMVRHGLDNERLPISETLEQAASIALMLLAEEARLAETAADNIESAKNETCAQNTQEIAVENVSGDALSNSEMQETVAEPETAPQAQEHNPDTEKTEISVQEVLEASDESQQDVISQDDPESQQANQPSENALLFKMQSEKLYELANRVADSYDHAKSGLEIIATARNYRIALLACAYDGFDSRGLPLDIIRAFIFEIENCALAVRDNALNPECARLAMTLLELVDELTDSYTASQKTFLNAFANEFPDLEASIAFRYGSKPKPQGRAEKTKKEKPNPWGDAAPKPRKDPWAEAESKPRDAETDNCESSDEESQAAAETKELRDDLSAVTEETVDCEHLELSDVPNSDEASAAVQEESKPQKGRKKRATAQGEKRARKPRVKKTDEIAVSADDQVSDNNKNVADIETIQTADSEKSDDAVPDEKPKRQRRVSVKKSETEKNAPSNEADGLNEAIAETEQSEARSEAASSESEI